MFLLFVVVVVIVEGVRRLSHGVSVVDGLSVVIVSGIAAAVMVVGAIVLGGDADEDDDDDGHRANLRAVLLDTIADAAAAAGVAVTGLIILATGTLYWLDPAVALVIAVIIGYSVLALLRDVTTTLRKPVARP